MGILLLILVCVGTGLRAETLHSYVNEKGVKVFTNIGVRRAASGAAGTGAAGPASARPSDFGATAEPFAYASLVQDSAARHQIDEHLIRAIMAVESDFNPRAVSRKGCIGLMQLHPATAKRFDVLRIYDPAENIEGGVKYLSFLMNYFEGNLRHVLAAYNAGENAVTRHQGVPPYRETQDYVRKVLRLYKNFGPSPPRADEPRLHRIILPNGNILYTNSHSTQMPAGWIAAAE